MEEYDFNTVEEAEKGKKDLPIELRIPVKPATHSGFKFTTFNPFPFYESPLFKWQVSSRIF